MICIFLNLVAFYKLFKNFRPTTQRLLKEFGLILVRLMINKVRQILGTYLIEGLISKRRNLFAATTFISFQVYLILIQIYIHTYIHIYIYIYFDIEIGLDT